MENKIDLENKISEKYNLTITDGLVDLTSENVAKVEAMIRYDSAYRKASSKKSEPKGNYFGSAAYFINNLMNLVTNGIESGPEYENIMLNIIKAIDRENSTHLNSDGCGFETIKNRICKLSYDELINKLKFPGPDYELIVILSERTNPSGLSSKGNRYYGRTNFSFASKFCHYMAMNIFEHTQFADNFSIYDNVLDNCIRKYIPRYANSFSTKVVFKGNYEKYIDCIDEIIKNSGSNISRKGFDHLLWYYYKGE